jgi:hypothetical protein
MLNFALRSAHDGEDEAYFKKVKEFDSSAIPSDKFRIADGVPAYYTFSEGELSIKVDLSCLVAKYLPIAIYSEEPPWEKRDNYYNRCKVTSGLPFKMPIASPINSVTGSKPATLLYYEFQKFDKCYIETPEYNDSTQSSNKKKCTLICENGQRWDVALIKPILLNGNKYEVSKKLITTNFQMETGWMVGVFYGNQIKDVVFVSHKRGQHTKPASRSTQIDD